MTPQICQEALDFINLHDRHWDAHIVRRADGTFVVCGTPSGIALGPIRQGSEHVQTIPAWLARYFHGANGGKRLLAYLRREVA